MVFPPWLRKEKHPAFIKIARVHAARIALDAAQPMSKLRRRNDLPSQASKVVTTLNAGRFYYHEGKRKKSLLRYRAKNLVLESATMDLASG